MKCVIDQRRETDSPLVCPPCRRGLSDTLRELVDAYAVLSFTDPGEVLDAGPVRAPNASARVSGSREAPVPVSLDLVDLTLPAREGSRAPHTRGVLGLDDTQVGYLSVATELDTWVRDWLGYSWCPGDHLPVPTVATLANWLSVRVDIACDHHEAIDEFAGDMRRMLRECQRAVGDVPVRPVVLDGVPCATPECDGILLHRSGDDYWAECGLCGRLWREDEYRQWVALVAAQTRVNDLVAVVAAQTRRRAA